MFVWCVCDSTGVSYGLLRYSDKQVSTRGNERVNGESHTQAVGVHVVMRDV